MMRPLTCLVDDHPQLVSELISAPTASLEKEKILNRFARANSDIILEYLFPQGI
jgi:hypothetical protein